MHFVILEKRQESFMLKDKSPEFFFTAYLYCFVLLKPVLVLAGGFSTIILGVGIAMIVGLDLYYNYRFKESRFYKWLIFVLFFLFILAAEIVFVKNDLIKTYSAHFALYAVIPLFLMINVTDYKKVLLWVYRLAILTGLLLIWDPLFGYPINSVYMDYGFNMAMYSFCGLVVGYYYFGKKKLLPFIGVELFAIAIWGNKGSLIASMAVLFVAMIAFGSSKKRYVIFTLTMTALLFFKEIVMFLLNLLTEWGFGGNYSVRTFKTLLGQNRNDIFSARTDIWKDAFSWVKEFPVFGSGIGSFETETGQYAHNIFVDVTVTFGILGLLCFVILLIFSVYRMAHTKSYELKIFQAGCFIFWIVAMQISLTFWNVMFFWLYWGIFIYGIFAKRRFNLHYH